MNFQREVNAHLKFFDFCDTMKIIATAIILIAISLHFIFPFIQKRIWKIRSHDNTIEKSQFNEILQHDFQRFYNQAQKQLLSRNKKLTVLYIFYKQIMYLKCRMYYGTNLTSIFTILSKQKLETTGKQHQIFENQSLEDLKKIIMKDLSLQKQNLLNILEKLENCYISIKQKLSSHQDRITSENYSLNDLNLKDFLKYNFSAKRQLKAIQQNVKNLIQQNENSEEKQIMNKIKNCVSLTTQAIGFVKSLNKQFTIFQKQQNQLMKMDAFDELQKIQILYQNLGQQYQKKQFLSQELKEVDSHLSKMSILNLEQFLRQFVEQNRLQYLKGQIERLQELNQKIKIANFQLEKSRNPSNEQSSSQNDKTIKLFGQISVSTKQNNQDLTKKSLNQKQICFSGNKRLSFIKQLDRLMIRNKIRREYQEIEKTFKNETNAHELQSNDEDESTRKVTLQVIHI